MLYEARRIVYTAVSGLGGEGEELVTLLLTTPGLAPGISIQGARKVATRLGGHQPCVVRPLGKISGPVSSGDGEPGDA